MIEFLLLALFQAVVGEPTAPPAAPTPPPAERVQPELAQQDQAATAQPPQERRMRRERVCEEIEVTGRRMPQRVCRTVLVPDETETAAD